MCSPISQYVCTHVCSLNFVCGFPLKCSFPPLSSAQDARMMEAAVAIPTAHEGSPQRGGNISYTGWADCHH